MDYKTYKKILGKIDRSKRFTLSEATSARFALYEIYVRKFGCTVQENVKKFFEKNGFLCIKSGVGWDLEY